MYLSSVLLPNQRREMNSVFVWTYIVIGEMLRGLFQKWDLDSLQSHVLAQFFIILTQKLTLNYKITESPQRITLLRVPLTFILSWIQKSPKYHPATNEINCLRVVLQDSLINIYIYSYAQTNKNKLFNQLVEIDHLIIVVNKDMSF